MNNKLVALALLTSLTATTTTNAYADEEKRNWEASAGLGLSLTSGNTDTTSINTNIQATQHLEFWEMYYKFDAIKQENENQTTADKKDYAIKGQYKLKNKSTFLFAEGKRNEDKFSSYAHTNTVSIGYGQNLYKSEDLLIKADVGPGYTYFKFNETGENGSSSIVHLGGHLKWTISDSAHFIQRVIVDKQLSDEKNMLSEFHSTLGARINGSLKMTLDVKVTHNSEVRPDKKKTDTITSVNLVYSF